MAFKKDLGNGFTAFAEILPADDRSPCRINFSVADATGTILSFDKTRIRDFRDHILNSTRTQPDAQWQNPPGLGALLATARKFTVYHLQEHASELSGVLTTPTTYGQGGESSESQYPFQYRFSSSDKRVDIPATLEQELVRFGFIQAQKVAASGVSARPGKFPGR
jgi:hypothetical protein